MPGIFINKERQQVIAYGASSGRNDPCRIAWSDVGNPTQWEADKGNQAGSYVIPNSMGIVAASEDRWRYTFVTAEGDRWIMQYVGYPIVYGFTHVPEQCFEAS